MVRAVGKATMRMLDFCRPDHRAGGFSLLEVLVVLVIISMAIAVIGPRLQKTYDAVVSSGERQDVVRQLERLPLVARSLQGLDLAAGSHKLNEYLVLPGDWHVYPVKSLRIEASGVCHAVSVRLQRQGKSEFEQVALREPDCVVEEI